MEVTAGASGTIESVQRLCSTPILSSCDSSPAAAHRVTCAANAAAHDAALTCENSVRAKLCASFRLAAAERDGYERHGTAPAESSYRSRRCM